VINNLPKAVELKLAANYFLNDVLSLVASGGRSLDTASSIEFVNLLVLLSEGKITSRVAKDLLRETVFDGKNALQIAEERGLIQDNSQEKLAIFVDEVIAANPTVVAEYKAGKSASMQFLVGQCMKATKGAGNPTTLLAILTEKLRQ